MEVKDIFKLNQNFKEMKVIGGASGLNRKIKDIEIMEVPDGAYWAVEGDFAITTGYIFLDKKNDLVNTINVLNHKKAAGLGIKVGRFLKEISPSIIELTDRLSFPLLEIPVHLGYSDITWPIMSKLLGDQNYNNYMLERFRGNLITLIDQNYDTDNILQVLENYIERSILLLSGHNQLLNCRHLYNSTLEKIPIDIIVEIINNNNSKIANISSPFQYKDEKYKFMVFPLKTPKQLVGYLCTVDNKKSMPNEDLIINLVNEALPFLTISVLSSFENKLIQHKSKNEFLKSLLAGTLTDRNTIDIEANYFNIDMSLNRLTWVMKIQRKEYQISGKTAVPDNLDDIIRKVLAVIKNQNNKDHLLIENDRIVCICPVQKGTRDNLKTKLKYLIRELELKFPMCGFMIGVSDEYEGLEYLSLAYKEAHISSELGSKISKKSSSIFYYDDLIVYHLLYELSSHSVINRIYRNTIEKICRYDSANNGDLYNTLVAFRRNNFNLSKTSDELYIHRNTLYKRLRKIEEITGYDLESSEARLIMHLGLKIHEIYTIDQQ